MWVNYADSWATKGFKADPNYSQDDSTIPRLYSPAATIHHPLKQTPVSMRLRSNLFPLPLRLCLEFGKAWARRR